MARASRETIPDHVDRARIRDVDLYGCAVADGDRRDGEFRRPFLRLLYRVPKPPNPAQIFRPMQIDAPDHARFRRPIHAALSPRAVANQRGFHRHARTRVTLVLERLRLAWDI